MEINNLILFLKWVSEIDNNDWPPQDRKYLKKYREMELQKTDENLIGEKLIREKGCLDCHKLTSGYKLLHTWQSDYCCS
ncbi:MAG: hypothetical protein AB1410_04155 [Acidobacteriota bacterium]